MTYVPGHEGHWYCPICDPNKVPAELKPKPISMTARCVYCGDAIGQGEHDCLNKDWEEAQKSAPPSRLREHVNPKQACGDEGLITVFGKVVGDFLDTGQLGIPDDNPSNPKQAYGDAKVPAQLVPPVIDIYAALALGEGADKYGPYNYRNNPVEMMTYIGAIRRHLDALLDGEYMDPGYWQDDVWFPPKPHLAGVIASAGIIADTWENGTIIDNRPKKGAASELLKKYQRDNRPGHDSAPDPRDEVPASRKDVSSDGDLGERGGG
jgi:hypothetical protein